MLSPKFAKHFRYVLNIARNRPDVFDFPNLSDIYEISDKFLSFQTIPIKTESKTLAPLLLIRSTILALLNQKEAQKNCAFHTECALGAELVLREHTLQRKSVCFSYDTLRREQDLGPGAHFFDLCPSCPG